MYTIYKKKVRKVYITSSGHSVRMNNKFLKLRKGHKMFNSKQSAKSFLNHKKSNFGNREKIKFQLPGLNPLYPLPGSRGINVIHDMPMSFL